MNGLELAAAVHSLHPGIPVLLTTGYVDRSAHRDFGRDITGVIPKPYDGATITSALRRTLDRR
jgi:two-component system NtrC family sensor kinase